MLCVEVNGLLDVRRGLLGPDFDDLAAVTWFLRQILNPNVGDLRCVGWIDFGLGDNSR